MGRKPLLTMSRRQAISAAIAGGAILASPRWAVAQTSPADIETILSFVDPELREAAGKLVGPNAYPPITADTLAIARKYNGPPPAGSAKVPVVKRTIAGSDGMPDVTIWIINPQPAGSNRPAILHTHGGGFIMGTAEAAILSLQDICLALNCPAVSVEYRLAPETTFKGSVEDNYAGLKWLYAHAVEIGADPRRIALLGESAGGGHAALLALTARDRGEIPVAFQCLVYPMLDDRTGTSRPVPPHIGQILWRAQDNRFGWQSFLGTEPGLDSVPHAGVPARAADLHGLPPAFIGTGSIDLFVDEDIEFGRRLVDAGVSTELLVVPGAFHGFDVFAPESGPARRFKAAIISALGKALTA